MKYVRMKDAYVLTVLSHLPLLSIVSTGRRAIRRRPILHFLEPVSSMCHHVFTDLKFIIEVNPSLTD